MPQKPGTRLGYEVLSELGAGGRAEVYKARDLKRGRDIAIKVLPQEMASDSSRLRRFEQEARAASALNNPDIAHMYEIGEHAPSSRRSTAPHRASSRSGRVNNQRSSRFDALVHGLFAGRFRS